MRRRNFGQRWTLEHPPVSLDLEGGGIRGKLTCDDGNCIERNVTFTYSDGGVG